MPRTMQHAERLSLTEMQEQPDDYRTPYEKLLSLPRWEQFLKPGVTAQQLHQQASRRSDTAAAQQMQQAKATLLTRCQTQRHPHLSPAARRYPLQLLDVEVKQLAGRGSLVANGRTGNPVQPFESVEVPAPQHTVHSGWREGEAPADPLRSSS